MLCTNSSILATLETKRAIERRIRRWLRDQRNLMNNNQTATLDELPPEPTPSPAGQDAEADPLVQSDPQTPSSSPDSSSPSPNP